MGSKFTPRTDSILKVKSAKLLAVFQQRGSYDLRFSELWASGICPSKQQLVQVLKFLVRKHKLNRIKHSHKNVIYRLSGRLEVHVGYVQLYRDILLQRMLQWLKKEPPFDTTDDMQDLSWLGADFVFFCLELYSEISSREGEYLPDWFYELEDRLINDLKLLFQVFLGLEDRQKVENYLSTRQWTRGKGFEQFTEGGPRNASPNSEVIRNLKKYFVRNNVIDQDLAKLADPRVKSTLGITPLIFQNLEPFRVAKFRQALSTRSEHQEENLVELAHTYADERLKRNGEEDEKRSWKKGDVRRAGR